MAEVFAAKLYGTDGFEKDLVIKQILPQYARDPEFVQSFVAEAKIAVSLTHANIVSIYELGRVDGTYFIAMEYVDGLDVFTLLDAARRHDDPLDPGLALLLVEEVSRGLEYAHRKLGPDGLPLGLVHRDLNPRNVLVSREGDVKILDFGIAKTASKSAAMPKTRAGVVKGTTGYMSPEQATGQPIDLRTDIYQSGLLLHECLTGRALFWRPEDHVTRELMRRHEVSPPSRTVRGLPPEIDDIVLTALRVRPEERFQAAAELAAAVARVRAIRYPRASHLALGDWVSRLIERDRAAARAVEDEIPATADFSEVISQAIEQSITGRVETIATRSPSGVFARPKRPTTGSQPLDPSAITGDLVPLGQTPAPVAPTAVFAGTPISGEYPPSVPVVRRPSPILGRASAGADRPSTPWGGAAGLTLAEHPFADPSLPTLEIGSLPEGTPRPSLRTEQEALRAPKRTRAWMLGGLAALALTSLLAAPWAGSRSVEEAPLAASPGTFRVGREDPSEPRLMGAPGRTGGAPARAPEATEDREEAPRLLRAARPAAAREPKREPAEAPALADFGAKPCASRVTIDGRLLTSPTPLFDEPLAPGRHRVVMVAEGCPPENAPGALEPKKLRLSTELEAEPGVRLKIVADFDRRAILVRRSGR